MLTFDPTITVITNSIQTHTCLPACLSGYRTWTSSQTERMQCKDEFSLESWLPLQPHADRTLPSLRKCVTPSFCSSGDLQEHSGCSSCSQTHNQHVESVETYSMQSNRGRLKGDFSTSLRWKLNMLPPWVERARQPGRSTSAACGSHSCTSAGFSYCDISCKHSIQGNQSRDDGLMVGFLNPTTGGRGGYLCMHTHHASTHTSSLL